MKKRNKTYVKAVTGRFDGKPEFLSMQFDSPEKGDQELIDRVTKAINDNWNDLFDDVKGLYFERVTSYNFLGRP
mgnify:CR=1 FL=1